MARCASTTSPAAASTEISANTVTTQGVSLAIDYRTCQETAPTPVWSMHVPMVRAACREWCRVGEQGWRAGLGDGICSKNGCLAAGAVVLRRVTGLGIAEVRVGG